MQSRSLAIKDDTNRLTGSVTQQNNLTPTGYNHGNDVAPMRDVADSVGDGARPHPCLNGNDAYKPAGDSDFYNVVPGYNEQGVATHEAHPGAEQRQFQGKAKGHNAVQRISNRYAVDVVAVSIAYGGHCCQKGVVVADDARWGAFTKILP